MAQHLALCFSVTRVFCYSLYKTVCCVRQALPKPQFELLCLGLDSAGKTACLASYQGDADDAGPTPGFSVRDLHCERALLRVKEIGGSHQLRPYWPRYFTGELDAVVFVVDASESDASRLEQARSELLALLRTPALLRLPVFVLATHRDCPGARAEAELQHLLQLHEVTRAGEVSILLCSSRDRDSVRLAFNRMSDCLLLADSQAVYENRDAA